MGGAGLGDAAQGVARLRLIWYGWAHEGFSFPFGGARVVRLSRKVSAAVPALKVPCRWDGLGPLTVKMAWAP